MRPPLKEHQRQGVAAVSALRQSSGKPVLCVAPPGAGKSRVMLELTLAEVAAGGTVLVMVHRTMLLEQMERWFREEGVDFGVISPVHRFDLSKPVQIVSTATLYSRGILAGSIDLPDATLVLIDEAHQQNGKMSVALLHGAKVDGMMVEGYMARGASVIGFTATPLMGRGPWQHLVELGTYSELRRCGMHSWLRVVGPTEIDTRGLEKNAAGEYRSSKLAERAAVVVGSVYDNWRRLNPDARPAILFAPSTACSKWFAEQFMRRGVRAAHISAESILLPEDGRLGVYQPNTENRDALLAASRNGDVQVVCNRFVLREAIDMPWLYHGIFATVMGGLSTALQSAGRLQRYFPEYPCKIMQDHGGFFWRHGSPNVDRYWELGMTNKQAALIRLERLKKGEETEGIRCPKCGTWRMRGDMCPTVTCRHRHTLSVRVVRQVNGQLVEHRGSVLLSDAKPDPQKLWNRTLFMMQNKKVAAAVAVFSKQAVAAGIEVDVMQLRHSPPADKREWSLPVKEVYPWTAK